MSAQNLHVEVQPAAPQNVPKASDQKPPWPGAFRAVGKGPVWRKSSQFSDGQAGGRQWKPGGSPRIVPGARAHGKKPHALGWPLQRGCISQVCVPRSVSRDTPNLCHPGGASSPDLGHWQELKGTRGSHRSQPPTRSLDLEASSGCGHTPPRQDGVLFLQKRLPALGP